MSTTSRPDRVTDHPSPGRRRAAEARRAHAAAAARRRRRLRASGAGVALAVAVGAGIAVQADRASVDPGSAVPGGTDAGSSGTAFAVGSAQAPVTIDVYEDFLCPACREVQARLAPTLDALVAEGSARVRYRPMAFLDRASTDGYSTRALNAAACAADSAGPAAYGRMHGALFAEQPAEGGPGLPDDRLVALAAAAGADDPDVEACIVDLRFEDWTRTVTEAASQAGVTGTPTIVVGGHRLDELTPDALRAAVAEAGMG